MSWGSVLLRKKIQMDKPAKKTGKVRPGRQVKACITWSTIHIPYKYAEEKHE